MVYHGILISKRIEVTMDRCYQRKYRQKIKSLVEVTFKGQNVTFDDVTSTRVLRYQ